MKQKKTGGGKNSQMQVAPPQSDAKPSNAPSLNNTGPPQQVSKQGYSGRFQGYFAFGQGPLVFGYLLPGMSAVFYRTGQGKLQDGNLRGGTILYECHRTATFSFEWHLSKACDNIPFKDKAEVAATHPIVI